MTGKRAVALVAILVLSSMAVFVSYQLVGDLAGVAPQKEVMISHNIRSNITIIGDDGFLDSNVSTGILSGSGTASDPYIIEGYDIDLSIAGTHGIVIRNTSAHFTVRDCIIHDGGSNYVGILLNNCTNGTLSDNNCSNDRIGITLFLADGNTVVNNNCSSNNLYGIFLRLSNNSNIVGNNTCLYNQDGILLRSSNTSNAVSGNTCLNNTGNGIWLEYSCGNVVSNNTCSDNDNHGVYLINSNSDVLSNNTCRGNVEGFEVDSSDSIIMNDNKCDNNTVDGIYVQHSNHIILTDNICNDNSGDSGIWTTFAENVTAYGNICNNQPYGLYLDNFQNCSLTNNTCNGNTYEGLFIGIGLSSRNGLIANNTCNNNEWGIRVQQFVNCTVRNNVCNNNSEDGINLYNSISVLVYNNSCSGNLGNGVYIDSTSSDNIIWNNTFSFNNGTDSNFDPLNLQSLDDGADNWWNSTGGYGNWWSDWQGRDFDVNGIQDAPYNISGSAESKDYFPLAGTPVFVPEFSEIAIPLFGLMLIALVFGRAMRRREDR